MFGDASGVIHLAGLIAPRRQPEISADSARLGEALRIIDGGDKGQGRHGSNSRYAHQQSARWIDFGLRHDSRMQSVDCSFDLWQGGKSDFSSLEASVALACIGQKDMLHAKDSVNIAKIINVDTNNLIISL